MQLHAINLEDKSCDDQACVLCRMRDEIKELIATYFIQNKVNVCAPPTDKQSVEIRDLLSKKFEEFEARGWLAASEDEISPTVH